MSPRTVHRRLCDAALNSRYAKRKPYLRELNIQKRLYRAKAHLNWTWKESEDVLRSDEAPFQIFGSKSRQRVRVRSNEALHPNRIHKIVKFGGGKVIVLGCFSAQGTGPLAQVNGKMDQKVNQ